MSLLSDSSRRTSSREPIPAAGFRLQFEICDLKSRSAAVCGTMVITSKKTRLNLNRSY
jgi:hypothetical protein